MLDAEAVGVGGDHRQPAGIGLQQDAGEDRANLVARGGTGDEVDRRRQRDGGQAHRLALELGETREILDREGAKVKPSPAGGDLDVALLAAELERDLARRQAANDIAEQPSGQQHGPLLLGLGVGELARQRELHVRGSQGQITLSGLEQDPAERGQGAAGRNGAPDKLQRAGQ